MPEQDFSYDAFLSHASEDTEWCERLATRLRDEGVRVWFDKWELRGGDHLLVRLNDAIKVSRKMIAVWTHAYFKEEKVWTFAEAYSSQHADVLAQDRPLIPVLRENCGVLPLFRNLISIDFRNDEDFDLRLRELIQSLDLPRRDLMREKEFELREHYLEYARAFVGHVTERTVFADEVAALYHLLGFEVKQNVNVSGIKVDVTLEQRLGGLTIQAAVACRDKRITVQEQEEVITQKAVVQSVLPHFRYMIVSSRGFDPAARTTLEQIGVSCTTYAELLHGLVPLDKYVSGLIAEYEEWVRERWQGEDWFIRPDLLTDITYEKRAALEHIGKWLGDARGNLLTILGDLGTGKSTLASFLAYNLARSFRDDPLRHPAPVLIPLKEVRKEVSLEGIVISHFSKRGLPDVNFPRFEHLVRRGKIILFFDAFDEMADRVRWDITQSNFRELRRAAEQSGKVILTCRTHYFKDRMEQVKLIGVGPRLSETETELYRQLRQQSGAEVVYLQEFDDAQIRTYLNKARPHTAVKDWEKIKSIYNLEELAHRPLLLDIIVKSLPRLEAGKPINAASLYKVYTEFWLDREEKDKGRILDKQTKFDLMLELAWRLWHEETPTFHYRDLVPFVERLVSDKVVELGSEETQDVASEMQAATFLKRDDTGNFSFMHRSFMEYFLALKILNALADPQPGALRSVLNTRRFNWEVVYFLTLLCEHDEMCAPLQQILTSAYQSNVSENALQILYWSTRVRCDMIKQLGDPQKLRDATATRIPRAAQLAGANLQEVILEAATLINANFTGADLTKAKLTHTQLSGANFTKAIMTDALIDASESINVNFQGAILTGASFSETNLAFCTFTDASFQTTSFVLANLTDAIGISTSSTLKTENLTPVMQTGHGDDVESLAFSPDGELLTSGGGDGLLLIYRVSDGRLLRMLEGNLSKLLTVAFSPDGKLLAIGDFSKSLRLLDVETGKVVRTFGDSYFGIPALDFSPDGGTLAIGSFYENVYLVNVSDGRRIHKLTVSGAGYMLSVAFSPDGKLLAVGSQSSQIHLWDTGSGKKTGTLTGHLGRVNAVTFSPDGKLLASASEDKSVCLWDAGKQWKPRKVGEHEGDARTVAFSPDGKTLVSGGSDSKVRMWEVGSGREMLVLPGHKFVVRTVKFSRTGGLLASGGHGGVINLWEANIGRAVRTIQGHERWINSIAFSPDGSVLVSGGYDGDLKSWAVKGDRSVQFSTFSGVMLAVAFSPNGKLIASASYDKVVELWNAFNGAGVGALAGHDDYVYCVAFSPDGEMLASGAGDGSVTLWRVKDRTRVARRKDHKDKVMGVAFSPDGQRLVSGGRDKEVHLSDVERGTLLHILQGHRGDILSVSYSPDGTWIASGSVDKTVRLWDGRDGKPGHTLSGHQYWVRATAFSPDGKMLASGSDDNSVCLWEVESGRLLRVLKGHAGKVNTVAFSPNGKYLIAAGTAGRLQFWDFERGEPFLYRYEFGPGAWLDLLPDGRFDASPDGMRYLCYTERGTFNSYTAEELVKEFYAPEAVQEVIDRYLS